MKEYEPFEPENQPAEMEPISPPLAAEEAAAQLAADVEAALVPSPRPKKFAKSDEAAPTLDSMPSAPAQPVVPASPPVSPAQTAFAPASTPPAAAAAPVPPAPAYPAYPSANYPQPYAAPVAGKPVGPPAQTAPAQRNFYSAPNQSLGMQPPQPSAAQIPAGNTPAAWRSVVVNAGQAPAASTPVVGPTPAAQVSATFIPAAGPTPASSAPATTPMPAAGPTPAASAPAAPRSVAGQMPGAYAAARAQAPSPYSVNMGSQTAPASYATSSYGQTPYGQTAYGQNTYGQGYAYGAAPPAPKKKRVKKPLSGRAAVVICLILTLILSPALGFGGAWVARSVLPDIAENIMVVPDVSNPWGDVVDSIIESSASIWIQTSGGFGAGSGVVISSDGYILTNWHVAGDPAVKNISVTLFDSNREYDATLIATEKSIDTALIKIDARNLTHVKIGDSDRVKVGDVALAIGNPLGFAGHQDTVSAGIIAHAVREVLVGLDGTGKPTTLHLLQTTVPISQGNSGGGLFNYRGELIGLNNAGDDPSISENIAFAVPINDALDLIHAGNYLSISREASLYIQTEAAAARSDAQRLGGDGAGVIITSVERYGAGYYAGLQAGDRIVSANKSTFTSAGEFNGYIAGLAVNETVELVISRGVQQYLYTLKTMRLPQN